MQTIMPAAASTLALSSPALISSSFITHPVPDSLPSSCSSPTIAHISSSHSPSPACTVAPQSHPDHLLIATVHDPSTSPLPSQPPPAVADHCLPSHSCKFCSRSFSCGRALGGHMRAHGSFYDLCEGAGSSADIMAKADDHRYSDKKQNESNENEFLIDLSSNCKSETDDQYEEDELMYVLRRKPKRSRRFADQDFTNEEEALLNKRNVDGDDPKFAGRIMPAERYKKPMFTCKLQDKAPPACTECGKEFNSWKALFGHMRCHPEREWRGIQPPAEYMSSMKAHKDSVARNGTMESNRYIVVKPLQASKHELLRRKEMVNQFRSSQSATLSHDVNKANYNQSREDGLAEDTMVGCIRGDEKLQWSSCRKQVMLEEEEESDTESIEAAYISNNKDEDDKCLHLLASFSRGKRSKRSHFTVKSLRSVQDQLAAKVVDAQPRDEDLEMANCLVMLAFAGSVNVEGKNQEGAITVSKSDDDDGNDDDEEGTVDDQLRLTWGSNLCATADESKTDASNLDGTNAGIEGGKYECAACKRSFKSHQALGGHRASHKKVKGCFAKTAADVEAFPTCKDGIATTSTYLDTSILTLAGVCKDQTATATTHLGTSLPDRNGDCKELIATSSTYVGTSTSAYDVSGGHVSSGGALNMAQGAPNIAENGPFQLLLVDSMDGVGGRSSKLALHNPSKFHQCSICQRVFSSGQALGGHKRCHWAADKADRHITAISEMGTGISTTACVATPPAMAKITCFTRPPPVEEATHQVKVLDIDLNLPAPLDVDPGNSTNANVNACKYNSTLGSLLSLGQCSNVTIHGPIDVDDDSFHSGEPHMTGHRVAPEPAAYSGTSSPSSTASIHISEIGPCL